jgi:hypothetical protein
MEEPSRVLNRCGAIRYDIRGGLDPEKFAGAATLTDVHVHVHVHVYVDGGDVDIFLSVQRM